MNSGANLSVRSEFDCGQPEKAPLKEIPSRLEPTVPHREERTSNLRPGKPCTLTSFLCSESLGLRSAGPQVGGLVEQRDLRTRQG
jgi:hypothetical protein